MSDRKKIGIRELKNRASRIVDEVREREEDYIVTKRGEPVAVLRPWSVDDERADRADRARAALATLSDLAQRVAQAAGRRSARAAVSDQRR
ncbi:MAG: type II toxin-antitoxin system Phd/YefM family antitoxin [Thermoanaerobaculia bacterium]